MKIYIEPQILLENYQEKETHYHSNACARNHWPKFSHALNEAGKGHTICCGEKLLPRSENWLEIVENYLLHSAGVPVRNWIVEVVLERE